MPGMPLCRGLTVRRKSSGHGWMLAALAAAYGCGAGVAARAEPADVIAAAAAHDAASTDPARYTPTFAARGCTTQKCRACPGRWKKLLR